MSMCVGGILSESHYRCFAREQRCSPLHAQTGINWTGLAVQLSMAVGRKMAGSRFSSGQEHVTGVS